MELINEIRPAARTRLAARLPATSTLSRCVDATSSVHLRVGKIAINIYDFYIDVLEFETIIN